MTYKSMIFKSIKNGSPTAENMPPDMTLGVLPARRWPMDLPFFSQEELDNVGDILNT